MTEGNIQRSLQNVKDKIEKKINIVHIPQKLRTRLTEIRELCIFTLMDELKPSDQFVYRDTKWGILVVPTKEGNRIYYRIYRLMSEVLTALDFSANSN